MTDVEWISQADTTTGNPIQDSWSVINIIGEAERTQEAQSSAYLFLRTNRNINSETHRVPSVRKVNNLNSVPSSANNEQVPSQLKQVSKPPEFLRTSFSGDICEQIAFRGNFSSACRRRAVAPRSLLSTVNSSRSRFDTAPRRKLQWPHRLSKQVLRQRSLKPSGVSNFNPSRSWIASLNEHESLSKGSTSRDWAHDWELVEFN